MDERRHGPSHFYAMELRSGAAPLEKSSIIDTLSRVTVHSALDTAVGRRFSIDRGQERQLNGGSKCEH